MCAVSGDLSGSNLLCYSSGRCRLLDGQLIQTWEVVDVFCPEGSAGREKFRFDVCIGRAVGRTPVTDVQVLDLSHCRLEYLSREYLASLSHLQQLLLRDNFLGDDMVESAHISGLHVHTLDLRNNLVSTR